MAEEYLQSDPNAPEEFERVSDPLYGIVDNDWIGQAFLVDAINLTPLDAVNRTFSSADLKFTDSSIGGNIAINPPPQPSRLTDPRVRSRRRGSKRVTLAYEVDVGMGPWYSETIDDNSDILQLQFGTHEFNSLISFWSRSVDYATSVIVSSGRSPIPYTVGNWIGTAAVFMAFPIVSTLVYGVKALNQLMSSDQQFSYYYMKPDMVNFWKTANIIATSFCIEGGILAPQFMSTNEVADKVGVPVTIDQDDMNDLKKLMPNMFTKNNNIDLMYLAGRAQSLANAQFRIEKRMFDEGILSNKDFIGYVKENTSKREKGSAGEGIVAALNDLLSLSSLPESVYKEAKEVQTLDDLDRISQDQGGVAYGYKDPYVMKTTNDGSPTSDMNNPTNETKVGFLATISNDIKDFFASVATSFDASVRGGGAYLNVRVDHVGSYTDSVDNATTSIPAGDAVKQISAKSKEIYYSMSGGNIAMGMDKFIGGAKDVIAGALDGVTFGLSSAIPALFGGGFIDLPLMWDDSNFSAPTTSFTVPLLAPSADTITKLIHEWIPLSCLIAGAFPRAIGSSSYSSPFLCSAFMKGKLKIDLGLITSIAITRSTANLGYDKLGRALGIDVTFTVSDLSARMAAPVNNSAVSTFFSSFDDSSAINRYISTIAARDLMTSKFSVPRAKLKLSRALMTMDTITSGSFFGARVGQFLNPVLGGFLHENNLTMLHTNDMNR